MAYYTERTSGEIIHALECWEARHPWPDELCLAVGEKIWTPWEFMRAIKNGGPQSYELLGFIVAQARRFNEDPLDYVGRMIREAVARAEEDCFSTV